MSADSKNQSVEKLRCGVVGVGRMGRHHARVYAQRPDVEFVGVVDPDTKRAADIIEQWGGRAFDSVEQLIAAGVDAATVATPTVKHRAAVEPLLSAGVACLVEKPLAPTVDEAIWETVVCPLFHLPGRWLPPAGPCETLESVRDGSICR
jgi:predicted dehydrogenase